MLSARHVGQMRCSAYADCAVIDFTGFIRTTRRNVRMHTVGVQTRRPERVRFETVVRRVWKECEAL